MKMTKYTALLLAGVLAFSACSKDDRDAQGGAHKSEQAQEGRILSLSTEIDDLPAEVEAYARHMEFEGDFNNPNKPKTKFIFNPGDTIPLYTVIEQGGQKFVSSKPADLVVSSKVTTEGKRIAVAKNIELPAGVDENASFKIAGAIGVESVSAEGKFSVPAPTVLFEATEDRAGYYSVPMYFDPTEINLANKSGDEKKHLGQFELKKYGAFLRIPLKNLDTKKPYRVGEFEFRTQAFATAGSFDIFNKDANEQPSWETLKSKIVKEVIVEAEYNDKGEETKAEQTEDVTILDIDKKSQIVRVEQPVLKPNATQTYYMWIKPLSQEQLTLDVEVRSGHTGSDILYTLGSEEPDVAVGTTINKSASLNDDQKVYGTKNPIEIPSFERDLIISEVYIKETGNFVWEIYNASDEPKDLSDYYMVRQYLKNPVLRPKEYTQISSPLINKNTKWQRIMVDEREADRAYYDNKTYGINTDDAPSELLGFPNVGGEKGYRGIAQVLKADEVNGTSRFQKWILEPGETAVFLGSGVTYNHRFMVERSRSKNYKLKYVFWFEIGAGDIRLPFYIDSKDTHWLAKDAEGTQVVDVFFKFNSTDPDARPNIAAATYMRKPFRDTPRKVMSLRPNSDWVWRKPTENIDWGRRFSFAWDEYAPIKTLAKGKESRYFIWMDYKKEFPDRIWTDVVGPNRYGLRDIRPLKYVNPTELSRSILRKSGKFYPDADWTYSVINPDAPNQIAH